MPHLLVVGHILFSGGGGGVEESMDDNTMSLNTVLRLEVWDMGAFCSICRDAV